MSFHVSIHVESQLEKKGRSRFTSELQCTLFPELDESITIIYIDLNGWGKDSDGGGEFNYDIL
jgi:hypothetical protein